jgi:hypothetical protein
LRLGVADVASVNLSHAWAWQDAPGREKAVLKRVNMTMVAPGHGNFDFIFFNF